MACLGVVHYYKNQQVLIMKKLMTLICALFLTSGMAIAQEGGDDGPALNNEAIIEQATAITRATLCSAVIQTKPASARVN
jgi:hypothetical protein